MFLLYGETRKVVVVVKKDVVVVLFYVVVVKKGVVVVQEEVVVVLFDVNLTERAERSPNIYKIDVKGWKIWIKVRSGTL